MLLGATLLAPGATALGDVSTGLVAPRDACPEQGALDAPEAVQLEAMLCMTDYARERSGLAPLADAPELDWSADAKAGDILRCDSFSHYACGRDFTYWMRESGYFAAGCWRAAENLAWGVGPYGTVRSVFIALMHSPPHRRNILGPFNRIGIGLRVGYLAGRRHTHVWVEHFGSHCTTDRTGLGVAKSK